MLNKVSAEELRAGLSRGFIWVCTTLICHWICPTREGNAMQLAAFFKHEQDGEDMFSRVCLCVACAYNLAGGSCTGDQGSSELVSPLKAFLPLWMEGPVDLLCREFRSRAKAR